MIHNHHHLYAAGDAVSAYCRDFQRAFWAHHLDIEVSHHRALDVYPQTIGNGRRQSAEGSRLRSMFLSWKCEWSYALEVFV